MPTPYCALSDRSYSGAALGSTPTVELYSWRANGGPYRAQISLSGSIDGLWRAAQMLRYSVAIYSGLTHKKVWWGYVHEISITCGGVEVGVSLDRMSNYVAVAYSSIVTDQATAMGVRKTTAWNSDANSLADYGYKSLLYSTGGARDTEAVYLRDRIIATNKYPTAVIRAAPITEQKAILRCRGWWETLAWKYYSHAVGSDTTTAILSNVISSCGQFLGAVTINDASGIIAPYYYSGDENGLQAAEALLSRGTTAGKRLFAVVNEDRTVTVTDEPTTAEDTYTLLSSMDLVSPGATPIPRDECRAGMWARLRNAVPITADLSYISDPTLLFVEEAEYNAKTNTYRPTAKNTPGLWDLAQDATEEKSIMGAWKGSTSAIKVPSVLRSIEQVTGGSQYSSLALTLPNLRGYWPMSAVNESGNVMDISGQGRTLTNNNAATFGVANSLVPYVDTNGSNQYLSRADEAGLDITGAFTAFGWFYHDTAGATSYYVPFAKHGAAGQRGWALIVGNGTIAQVRGLISVDGTANFEVNSGAVPTTAATWHFYALRFTPSTEWLIYWSGTKYANATSVPASCFNNTSAFIVGTYAALASYFDGKAFGIGLCAAALTDGTLERLYNTGRVALGV